MIFGHQDRVRIVVGICGSRPCVEAAREEGVRLGRVFGESEIVCACGNGVGEILIDEIDDPVLD